MLPNFRRSETDPSRSQTTASIAETSTAPSFQPRPYLTVPRAETPRSVSVIGTDLTIAGNLICKGEVQVDGIIEGDIQGSNVVVGESATVTGSISAEEVVVRGHVVGSVHSRRVMLQTTSQVEGDIYPSVTVDRAGRHVRRQVTPHQRRSADIVGEARADRLCIAAPASRIAELRAEPVWA